MSIPTEQPTFSSLGPILKTTIKDRIHQNILLSLASKEKSELPNAIKEIIEVLKTLPQDYLKKSLLDKLVAPLPLSGSLPYRIDLFAKGVIKAFEAYSALQEKFNQLTDAEKVALLKQLPENSPLKDILSGNLNKLVPESVTKVIDPESIAEVAKVVHVTAEIIADVSNAFAEIGESLITDTMSGGKFLASLAVSQIKPSESLTREKNKISEEGGGMVSLVAEEVKLIWSLFAQGIWDVGTQRVLALKDKGLLAIKEKVEAKIGKEGINFDKYADLLTNNFAFLEETLNKIDSTLKELTPSKVLNCSFLSLDQFNQATIQAKENFPKNLPKNEESELKFQIYYAAANKRLPTPAMNQAFQLLCDPKDDAKSLRDRFIEKLQTDTFLEIKPSESDLEKAEKAFDAFCVEQNLKDQSPEALELIKAAFLVRYFINSSKNENLTVEIEASQFLSEMVLSNPKDFLGEQELQLDALMKKASAQFIKNSLYPTLVQKFLPNDFNELIRGMGKLIGYDLEESIRNAIANAIIENGISYLTNPQEIATLVLKTLNADVGQFSQITFEDGTHTGLQERFEKLLNSLKTAEYENALKGISAKQVNKTREEISKEKIGQIDDTMRSVLGQYSKLMQMFIGKPGRALGQEVLALSERKDWGLCLLMFSDQLNKTLKDPEKAPDLDLVSTESQLRIERLAKNLYPSSASLIRNLRLMLPNSIIKGNLQGFQDSFRSLNYSTYIGAIENNLLLNHFTKRFMDGLKYHSSQSLPSEIDASLLSQGIAQVLNHYVNQMVKDIWGVEEGAVEAEEYKKECLQFLNQLRVNELVDFVKNGTLKSELIKRKEIELKSLENEVDALILQPRKLTSVHPFNLANIDKRLKELEVKGDQEGIKDLQEMKKNLSAYMKMAKVHSSLALMYNTQIHKTSDKEVISRQEKIITQLEIDRDEMAEIIKLNQKDPLYANSLQVEKDQAKLKEFDQRLALQQQTLNLLIKQRAEKDLKLKGSKEAFLANPLVPKFTEAKKQLFLLLIDVSSQENNKQKIESQKEVVANLDRALRKEQNEFNQKEANLYGYPISPSTTRKMEFLKMRIDKARLEGLPEVNQNQLAAVRQSLKNSYLELLNFDFGLGIGLEGEKFRKELFEANDKVEKHLSELQLEKIELDKQEKNILEEIDLVTKEKQKLSDAFKELSMQNAQTPEDMVKLAEKHSLIDSIYTKGEQQYELEKKLAAKQKIKEEHIQTKEKSAGYLAKTFFSQKDPVLESLEKEISEITTGMQTLREAIAKEAISLETGPYKEAEKRLEKQFETTDLAEIKSQYEKKLAQAISQDEQLKILSKKLDGLQNKLTEVSYPKKAKESQINQILEGQKLILPQINGIKYLNSIDKELLESSKGLPVSKEAKETSKTVRGFFGQLGQKVKGFFR